MIVGRTAYATPLGYTSSETGPHLSVVHHLPPDLPEVHRLQPHPVRILEERRVVVRSVLQLVAGLGGLHPRLPQLPRHAVHGSLVDDAEAEGDAVLARRGRGRGRPLWPASTSRRTGDCSRRGEDLRLWCHLPCETPGRASRGRVGARSLPDLPGTRPQKSERVAAAEPGRNGENV
jgi:hypothetical protein